MAIGGPEAVVDAMVTTLETYLPAALTSVWADYNDASSVPQVDPRQYYAFPRELVLDFPAVIVEPWTGDVVSNEAPVLGEVRHRLIVHAIVRADSVLVLEKMAARYVRALWKVLMQHPGLDGSISCGVDPIHYELGDSMRNSQVKKLQKEIAWLVDVHMVETAS